jgi:hypothetical protein
VRLRSTSPFLLLAAVALAAGCGTAASAPRAATPAGATAVTSQPPSSPEQRAAAEATAILRQFVPPPGAVRLTKEPALPSGSPTMGLSAATQQDATGYWRVRGTATALLAWEKAHISRSFSRQDVIIGPPSWDTVYSLPPVPGVQPQREMNVQVYDTGGGTAVIMAEALVSWTPPRPAAEAIPASAAVATIAPYGLWPKMPAPVTITSAPAVRRLAALVNALPLSTTADDVPCPMAAGFTLTFRVAAGGPPVAIAAGPGACSQVILHLKGHEAAALQPPASYNAAVLTIAGLHWTLP